MAKTNKRKKAQKASEATAANSNSMTRRGVLDLARKGALGLGAVSIGGYFAWRAVQGGLYERDLTRLSAGKPTVVQIHDPNCPSCTALQKETRRALKCFGECELQYLIADIKTDEGLAFATRHGASHVTLLLFDADAQLSQIIQGVQTEADLKQMFEAHLAA